MDEHIKEPKGDSGPDPLYSPLHEGQLSLIPEAESHKRDYLPEESSAWSPVPPPSDEGDSRSSEDSDVAPADETDGVADPDGMSVPSSEGAGDESEEPSDDLDHEETPESEADAHPLTAPEALDGTTTAESELEIAAWPGLQVPASTASTYDLPPLERERPTRERLVPKWVYIAIAAFLGVVALAVGGVLWYLSTSQIAVPDVTGLQLSVARTRLERLDLDVQVTDRRFSAAPRDEVLEQSPAPGGEARRGSVVQLIVSAGTEEIVMPDVVGDGLTLARGELESRGLVVIVDAVPSDVPSDTVLGTTPAAGAIVRTGDTVRVTVAAPVGGSGGLSPFNMQGLGIVIDPAPTGTPVDTTMEIARRLRSLLEASGASVTVLRSATETTAPESVRSQAAATATGTVAIGLSVATSGPAGRHVSIPVTGTPDVLQRSQLLSSSITSQVASVAPPVTSSTSSTETVLRATKLPWVRLRLGSSAVREDQTRFSDPAWADQMARAIYTALGELYGVRGQ